MAADPDIEQALSSIAAALNGEHVEEFDRQRVQRIVDDAVGEPTGLSVDDGGGLHGEGGARVGAVRRTPSGEWIADRQNDAALHSDSAIPAIGEHQGPVRRLLAKLKS